MANKVDKILGKLRENDEVVGSVNGQTGNVVLTAADVGAAPELGEDDNYVTDAEKANLHAPGSDDQDLSGLVPYTGATTGVNLGEHGLEATQITVTGSVDTVNLTVTEVAEFQEVVQANSGNFASVGLTASDDIENVYQTITADIDGNVFSGANQIAIKGDDIVLTIHEDDPTPQEGLVYLNSTTDELRLYFKSKWRVLHYLESQLLTEGGDSLTTESGNTIILETAWT
jgi:hypothetical protein